MQDPVFTADGQTYERQAIIEWLEGHDTSPLTGRIIDHKFVVPNYAMRGMISELLAKYPQLAGAPEEEPAGESDESDEEALPYVTGAPPGQQRARGEGEASGSGSPGGS